MIDVYEYFVSIIKGDWDSGVHFNWVTIVANQLTLLVANWNGIGKDDLILSMNIFLWELSLLILVANIRFLLWMVLLNRWTFWNKWVVDLLLRIVDLRWLLPKNLLAIALLRLMSLVYKFIRNLSFDIIYLIRASVC